MVVLAVFYYICGLQLILLNFHHGLQLAGQNLGRVFNFRAGHVCTTCTSCITTKLPNLKRKTRLKQLLGSLLLAFTLTDFLQTHTKMGLTHQCHGVKSIAMNTKNSGGNSILQHFIFFMINIYCWRPILQLLSLVLNQVLSSSNYDFVALIIRLNWGWSSLGNGKQF